MKKKKKISILLLLLSAVLISAGMTTGGFHAVFRKAAIICLECIGIG